MYSNQRIALVLPCYNEAIGLERILIQLPRYIDEVIVVDNDSNDNTAQVAEKYGAQVIFEKRRGYGLACRAGLCSLKNVDVIIMMDGDNTIPVSGIEQFLLCMDKEGYNFLSGCRFPLKNICAMTFVKRISNYSISWIIRRIFCINLHDSQSGMFILQRRVLPDILPSNPGMGFGMEFKLNAWLHPLVKSGELYIDYGIRSGRVKYRALRDGMKTLKSLLEYFINYRSKKNKI